MRTSKFLLGPLIVALVLGVGASAFWAGHASSGSPSSEVKTYQPGWANIAWLGDTAPVDAALSSIADSVGIVYYLDPDSGSWQRYIPGRPEVSTLTTMAFGKSYLLLFTKPATLEQATQPEDVCAPGGCPSCPTPTQCPTPTACPDCPPATNPMSDLCTATKMGIETSEVLLEIAEAGQLVGTTASEVRVTLEEQQARFSQSCSGVPLLGPSLVGASCAVAGKWTGTMETTILYAPSAQDQVWANRFRSIVYKYCFAD